MKSTEQLWIKVPVDLVNLDTQIRSKILPRKSLGKIVAPQKKVKKRLFLSIQTHSALLRSLPHNKDEIKTKTEPGIN